MNEPLWEHEDVALLELLGKELIRCVDQPHLEGPVDDAGHDEEELSRPGVHVGKVDRTGRVLEDRILEALPVEGQELSHGCLLSP